MFIIRKLLPFIFILFMFARLFTQEAGLPFNRNFPSEEFMANRYNWEIVQYLFGIFNFGNNEHINWFVIFCNK
jgi:hypothetical protein